MCIEVNCNRGVVSTKKSEIQKNFLRGASRSGSRKTYASTIPRVKATYAVGIQALFHP